MSQLHQPNAALTAPPGWYPDPHQQGMRYWDGLHWSPHVVAPTTGAPRSASPATWSDPHSEARAAELARGIATYERVSGVLWIGLGLLQVLSLWLVFAGVWNLVAGISRLGIAPAIERREARIPQAFAGIVGLVVIALVNLFLGAMIGLVMVALDFYVRSRVLDNRDIFTKQSSA